MVIFGQYGPKNKYGQHVSGDRLIISVCAVIKSYLILDDTWALLCLILLSACLFEPKNGTKIKNGPDFFGSTCPKSPDILSWHLSGKFTVQIMETEKAKTVCEAEHQAKAAEYTTVQERLAYLLSDIPRTINRAKYVHLDRTPICDRQTDIHTHPFNGPLSGTTRVGRYQKGKTSSGFYRSKRQ